eukprot:UN04911
MIVAEDEKGLQERLKTMTPDEESVLKSLYYPYDKDVESKEQEYQTRFMYNCQWTHLYPVGSLISHSCFPNCLPGFHENEYLAP